MYQFGLKKGLQAPSFSENRTGNRLSCYPFDSMEPGDCFDVPLRDIQKQRNVIFSLFTRWKKKHGKTNKLGLVIREVPDERCVRVWMVSVSRFSTSERP